MSRPVESSSQNQEYFPTHQLKDFEAMDKAVLVEWAVKAQDMLGSLARLQLESMEREDYLEKVTHIDPLTGLANRSGLYDAYHKLVSEPPQRLRESEPESANQPNSVLFMDIDNLKQINDTFGHHIGDLELMKVANHLRRVLREEDIIARIGGDEFVVITQGLEPVGAEVVAKRILIQMERDEGPAESHSIKTRASIGIAPLDMDSGLEASLKHADQAMYRAKRNGGDQISIFEPDN